MSNSIRIGRNQATILRAIWERSSRTTGASEGDLRTATGLSARVITDALWALLEKGLVARDERGWASDDYQARRAGVVA